MKFTYDMSWFDTHLDMSDPYDSTFRINAEKALKIALTYFNNLIITYPKPFDAMKFN